MTEESTEQLSVVTVKVVEHLETWLKTTENLVVEQAPLVVQEIVSWGICKAIFGLVIAGLLLVLTVVCWRVAKWAYEKTPDKDDDLRFIISVLVGAVSGIIGIVVAYVSTYNLLFVLVAPRVYVLEEISKLVQSGV